MIFICTKQKKKEKQNKTKQKTNVKSIVDLSLNRMIYWIVLLANIKKVFQ